MPGHASHPSDRGVRLGPWWRWALDMGLVGLLSGAGAPMPLVKLSGVGYVVLAGVVGAALGALLGCVARWLVARRTSCAMRAVYALLGPVVGVVWGATTSGLACLALSGGRERMWFFAVVLGGLTGLVQVGWVWSAYAAAASRGSARWPWLVVSAVLAPLLGFASWAVLF